MLATSQVSSPFRLESPANYLRIAWCSRVRWGKAVEGRDGDQSEKSPNRPPPHARLLSWAPGPLRTHWPLAVVPACSVPGRRGSQGISAGWSCRRGRVSGIEVTTDI